MSATQDKSFRDNSAVLGDTDLQSEALSERRRNAPNYQDWLCSLAEPFLGDDPIELGSGLGDYAAAWLDGGLSKITVTEADAHRLASLEERFAGDERVRVTKIDLNQPMRGEYSSFVSFNVMEHIPDDVAAFRVARNMVRPGGFVVTFAPAFNFAMSDYDVEIGHVRRYSRKSMSAVVTAAGLESVELRYVNPAGLLAWYAGVKLLGKRPSDSRNSVSLWDRLVIPTSRRLDARVKSPFGQSVFSVARVPH
jgi:hypothetical protein